MTVDTKAFRERANSPQHVRGDTGGEYISTGWAEMIADNLIEASDEIDRLRAAITQALGQLAEATCPDPEARAATATLREAIGVGVGP